MNFIYGSTALRWTLAAFSVSRTPWTRDQPATRLLHTHKTAQTQNKRTQTSMPQVGFESTILVHALDRAATMIARELHAEAEISA
jgi:hypothetical protein